MVRVGDRIIRWLVVYDKCWGFTFKETLVPNLLFNKPSLQDRLNIQCDNMPILSRIIGAKPFFFFTWKLCFHGCYLFIFSFFVCFSYVCRLGFILLLLSPAHLSCTNATLIHLWALCLSFNLDCVESILAYM
jgi:hypothetical protein